jgi:hypothetical protein
MQYFMDTSVKIIIIIISEQIPPIKQNLEHDLIELHAGIVLKAELQGILSYMPILIFAWIARQIRPRPFPPTFLWLRYPPIILPFGGVRSQLFKMLLSKSRSMRSFTGTKGEKVVVETDPGHLLRRHYVR